MRRVTDRPRWWAVKMRIKEQWSGPHTHTHTHTHLHTQEYSLQCSSSTCLRVSTLAAHTQSCRKQIRAHVLFKVFVSMCAVYLEGNYLYGNLEQVEEVLHTSIDKLLSSICVYVSFLAAQTFTWRPRGLRAGTYALLVLLKRDTQKHTQEMHIYKHAQWREENLFDADVCVWKSVRVRQTVEEGQNVCETEEEEGRGRADVSGIESRGGRCLFINASWLLKGAFDWVKTHGSAPLSTHLPPPTTGRPRLHCSRQQGCSGAEGGWNGERGGELSLMFWKSGWFYLFTKNQAMMFMSDHNNQNNLVSKGRNNLHPWFTFMHILWNIVIVCQNFQIFCSKSPLPQSR